MSKEFLGKLMKVEQDHLKDAQMFINFSYQFKYEGNTEAMQYFADEAKHRLAKYDEVHAKTQQMLSTMTKADEDSMECICWKILQKQTDDWVNKMKATVKGW